MSDRLRTICRIVGKFMGAPPGAPAETWEELVPIRFRELTKLELTGDWCASPPTGGLEIALRDRTRISLAAAGPTNYRTSSPQPHVMGRDMPIESWGLQTDTLKVARKKVTGEVTGFLGTDAEGRSLSISLCQLKTLAFE